MVLDANEKNDWQRFNALGFIPGPQESEEEFLERVRFCLNLENELKQHADFPFENLHNAQGILQESFDLTDKLFGIRPSWVPLYFSNEKLAPWHGGCAWIFQLEKSPTAAFLQLRKNFLKETTYLKIYNRKELIAHELCHAGRMMYHEEKFEEFFAYQTSPSSFRRFFGPIIASSKESALFIISLLIAILTDFYQLFVHHPSNIYFNLVKLLPIFLLFFGIIRLLRLHSLLKRSFQNLLKRFSEDRSRHILYRLLDSEIEILAKGISNLECDFEKNKTFRWQFLKKIYFD